MNAAIGGGRSVESAVNAESVLDVAEAWRYETRGAVTGTPVHDGEVAYFGDWGGGVHAVRLATGERVWSVRQAKGVDSSLAIDGGRLLVADMGGNVSARDRATGEVVWSTRLDPHVQGVHLFGSPVPHEGRVYQGVASEQTMLEYEGPQDFVGSVACLDAATGAVLWQTRLQPPGRYGISVWSTPALDPELGLLFVGTGNAYGRPAGNLSDAIVALRMDTGEIAWSFQATPDDGFNARGSGGADADFGASPLLFEAGGHKLVGDGDKDGEFYALDRATGELVWEKEVDFVAPEAGLREKEGFLGTAAYRDGVIFAPTTDRSIVHALDAATGTILWARELNPKPQMYGERMFGSSTAADGIVLQGNAFGKLFALDAATGDVLVEVDVGGDVQGGVSLADDLILVPHGGEEMWDTRGGVAAYRVPRIERPTPATPTSAPTRDAEVDYVTPSTPSPEGPPETFAGGPEDLDPEARIIPGPGLAALALAAAMAARRRRGRA